MKPNVVSFKMAEKLLIAGFSGKSLFFWKENKKGKAKLKEKVSCKTPKLISLNELAPDKKYPAYTSEELLYGIYTLCTTNSFMSNAIPALMLNFCLMLKDKKEQQQFLKSPADFIARQIIKAGFSEYINPPAKVYGDFSEGH